MKMFLSLVTVFFLHACCGGLALAYPTGPVKPGSLIIKTAVIPNAGTTSAAIDLQGYTLVGLRVATMTGTAITYTMSDTFAGTYVAVHNSSGAVSTTVADDLYYAVDSNNFKGLQFIKLVSGSSEGAERTVYLYLRGI